MPIHAGRISPVFDVARLALMISLDQRVERARHILSLRQDAPRLRVESLLNAGVDVLICAAISQGLLQQLECQGVQVIAQVCGNTEAVLEAYLQGTLEKGAYQMPGCCGRRRGPGQGSGGGRGRGQGRGLGRGSCLKQGTTMENDQ